MKIYLNNGARCLPYALGLKLNCFAFSFIDGSVCNHVMRLDRSCGVSYLVLTILKEGAYLTFKSIFHEALNLF
mgnify:CR=1 FL=1